MILFCSDISSLAKAKAGVCYQKEILPSKLVKKEELIKVEDASEDFLIEDAKFDKVKKEFIISPSYTNIQSKEAKFEDSLEDLVISKDRVYFTLTKSSNIPLSSEYVNFVKSRLVDFDKIKIGECFYEFVKHKKVEVAKDYISKQAYEIIDIAPAKFRIVKKKILVKPAYTKIVKTPAIYETKIIKVLVEPSLKRYLVDGKKICVKNSVQKYKTIVRKILKKPPFTTIVKFPATYKEIEIKKMILKPIVTRRVIAPIKSKYKYSEDVYKDYFWSKNKNNSEGLLTGLSICKKIRKNKIVKVNVKKVKQPATTIKKEVKAKKVILTIEKKHSEAHQKKVILPPQYEKVNTTVKLDDSRVVWHEINCSR